MGQNVETNAFEVGRLRAGMTREPLRPLVEERGQRRHLRSPATGAIELADQLGGVRDRVALAFEAAGLTDDAIEIDVPRAPQPRLAVADWLTRTRHTTRLACPPRLGLS